MKLVEEESELIQSVSPQPFDSFEKELTVNIAGMCISEIHVVMIIILGSVSSHVKREVRRVKYNIVIVCSPM